MGDDERVAEARGLDDVDPAGADDKEWNDAIAGLDKHL